VAHPDGELRRRAANDIEVVPLAPRTELDLRAAWRFARLVKELAPDVIHAHDPHAVAMAALALSLGAATAKDRRGGPALIVSRRVDFHLRGNSFSRWKYRQADCFIAASDAIRAILAADGIPAARAVTVHEGIDLSYVAAAARVDVHEALWLPHHAPIVGNVAALVAHKGQRYLIDAAQIVVRQVPDVRFLIFGEGELREQLELQIRRHRLEKHVLLPGFRTDVIGCMKSFDVFVMSSVNEGLGTALLDAMACARPVVATRTGGIPEIVADEVTGVLVPPRDHAALARAIVRLLKDEPRRAALGAAGFARVTARFTVEQMVAETVKVYERVAGRGHAVDKSPPEPPPSCAVHPGPG
jgi:glycosyltransferase involved in cell wall biosynthesis